VSTSASLSPQPVLDGRSPRSLRRPGVEASLIAAVERLVQGGTPFSSLSIGQLVAEAGIGRATFYLYFPDRTAFLLRLADHAREQIAEPAAVMWEDAGADRAVLEAAIHTILRRFRENAAIISTVIQAAAVDLAVAERLDQQMRGFVELSAGALESARRAGATRPDLRARETATALSWMIERVCYQVVRHTQPAELDDFADAVSAIVWHSLHGDGPARPRDRGCN
jgi:AcrR family transcriptional regulator